jgi:hypothetical protein
MGEMEPDAVPGISGWRFVIVVWVVILDVFCNGAMQKAVLAEVGKWG